MIKYQIRDLNTNKLVKDNCTKGIMEFNTFISCEIYAEAFIKNYEIITIIDNMEIIKSRCL